MEGEKTNMKGAVKSVRFTPEVEAFINSYKGSDFTAKLTNIILDRMELQKGYYETLQQQRALLSELQQHYEILKRKYVAVDEEISLIEDIFRINSEKKMED